jgi:hypothetical protein
VKNELLIVIAAFVAVALVVKFWNHPALLMALLGGGLVAFLYGSLRRS